MNRRCAARFRSCLLASATQVCTTSSDCQIATFGSVDWSMS